MASSSNIDALPYYDKQVDEPAFKSAAQALIEAELKATPAPAEDDERLPPQVQVFPKSSSLAELLEGYPETRIQGIDTSKYNPPSVAPGADMDALKQAEERGRIGESHMALRNENAALLASYGPNAWLIRNYQLNAELKELQQTLEGLKEKVTDVNRTRRVFQEDTGNHLTRLETKWQDLVGSTVQLELACHAMEGEVRGLRRKESELREQVAALDG